MPELPSTVYIAGIGGMGAAPLALYLAGAGVKVYGWDDGLRDFIADTLAAAGVQPKVRTLPDDVEVFVHSSAIRADHPAYCEARARDLPILRRGEMLARVAEGRRLLAVVGSHGKTTTTGMIIHLLQRAGVDCGYVLGAFFREEEGLAPAQFAGGSEWLVAEVDESDGTIDAFSPEVTLAVNLDWDHPDRYPTREAGEDVFRQLFQRTRAAVLVPSGCKTLRALGGKAGVRVDMFGEGVPGEDFQGLNRGAAVTGASLVAGRQLDGAGLDDFKGIRRRQDILRETGPQAVVADYAHHPTEIRAVLHWLRGRFPGRRQRVVFEPHRYSRTRQYAEEFASALELADSFCLLPVYPAGEEPINGGEAEAIRKAAQRADVEVFYDEQTLFAHLQRDDETPQVVAFIGAGTIEETAGRYVRASDARADWFGDVEGKLSPDTKLYRDEPLANKTTMRVGGAALYYAEPACEADLVTLWQAARQAGVPVVALGRGSNIIVAPGGFQGLVVRLAHAYWREMSTDSEGKVRARGGVRLRDLCVSALKAGLAGFEFLEGIPGTVGGAMRMNAGAMGAWIFDVVESVRYVTPEGVVKEARGEELHAGYRCCRELVGGVVLEARFREARAEAPKTIRQTIDTYANRRKESQPRLASAGCIFKNPDGGHAGKLIDETGLKGLRVGDAEVSDVHANFIVNRGNAAAEDVLELARQVREQVRAKTGVELEPEVLLLGADWEEVLR